MLTYLLCSLARVSVSMQQLLEEAVEVRVAAEAEEEARQAAASEASLAEALPSCPPSDLAARRRRRRTLESRRPHRHLRRFRLRAGPAHRRLAARLVAHPSRLCLRLARARRYRRLPARRRASSHRSDQQYRCLAGLRVLLCRLPAVVVAATSLDHRRLYQRLELGRQYRHPADVHQCQRPVDGHRYQRPVVASLDHRHLYQRLVLVHQCQRPVEDRHYRRPASPGHRRLWPLLAPARRCHRLARDLRCRLQAQGRRCRRLVHVQQFPRRSGLRFLVRTA